MPVCRPRSRAQVQVGPGASLQRACLLTLLAVLTLSVLSTGMPPARAKQRSVVTTDSGSGGLGQGPSPVHESESESRGQTGGNRWRCPGCLISFFSLVGLNQHRGSPRNEDTACFANTSDDPMLTWRSLRPGAGHGARARSQSFASGPNRSRSISPDPGDDMGRPPSPDSMDEGGNGRAGADPQPQVRLCMYYV